MEQANTIDNPTTKTNPKYVAYAALRAQGSTHIDACKLIGANPNYMYRVARQGKINKYDLSNLEDKAYRLVKNFVQGKPIGNIEKIKDSTALTAAQMIMDRSQPVIKEPINQGNSINFVTINLNGPAKSSDMIAIYNDAPASIPSDTIQSTPIYNDDKIDMIDIDISKDKV